MVFGIIIWLVIGGVIGWTASVVMRAGSHQTILTNIIAGIVGAYVGGAFLAPALHAGPSLTYLSACLGALIVIVAVILLKRG